MDYTQFDDAALIAQIARQDRNAFEALYSRHAAQVLGVVMRLLGERSLSEDVAQEAFWRVWRLAKQFDVTRGNARAWVFSIAHHLAVDTLRKRKDGKNVELDAEDENGETRDLPDEMPEVLTQVWDKMSGERVRTAIKQLPETQRKVIELAYFNGLTHKEIASELNEAPGTVHTRARLAIIKMRELLVDMGAKL